MVPNETLGWIAIVAYFGLIAAIVVLGIISIIIGLRILIRVTMLVDLLTHPGVRKVRYTLEKVPRTEPESTPPGKN